MKMCNRNIYICYLLGERSVWEKTVPEVLSTALGLWPRAVLKTKGTVFSHTDRPSPVNMLFKYFVMTQHHSNVNINIHSVYSKAFVYNLLFMLQLIFGFR